MSKKIAQSEHDEYASAGGFIAPAAIGPVYADSLAAANSFRQYQWYLDGRLTVGGNVNGANVNSISTEYTGAGVKVGIIDQGFDIHNIDLAGRFDLGLSFDPRDTTGVTSIAPDSAAEAHGTWVSGVLGASASNQTGAVGVAPDATLVGYYARFGFGGSPMTELAQLLALQVNVDVSNSSWGYSTSFSDNFRRAAWSPVEDALTNAVQNGRDSLGTVYVFAAGNDRQFVANTTSDGDNTNNHSLTNSRFVITAAASTADGHIASFSTPGASILVTAPGDAIVTTTLDDGDGDASNDYALVSGTSFAAPIVSGVVAIMLQANPNLGYRDVQEILALSSHKIDPGSPSWATNGATNWNGGGNMVSHDFGFGLVDAHAAARLAETWTLHSTAANEQVISISGEVSQTPLLSQSGPNAYVATVSGHEHFSIDWVELDITLQNARNGDITIELISPDGTDSVLLDHPNGGTNAAGNLNFTFSTTHNWGETPDGNWTVVIHDSGTNGTDSIVSWSLRIYGDDLGANDTYYYTDDFATLSGERSTLSDSSGSDAINAAAVTTDLTLDLNAGQTSTIAGRQVEISAGTVIEKAYGGDGNDLIIGNGADNFLYGGRGSDRLLGERGSDTLSGGGAADIFVFDTGAIADAHASIPLFDRIADYKFAEGDQIDLSALLAAAYQHGGGQPIASLVRAVEDAGGAFANLQIDLDGAANGANFVTIARIDGMRIGTALNVVLDSAAPAGSSISVSAAVTRMPVNDFNGDGNSDLVWRNDAGTVAIWNMNDSAVLHGNSLGAVPANWKIAGTGDFNGDGNSDLLWRNEAGVVAIWNMKDGTVLSGDSLGAVPANWHIAGTGDFNGDGNSDLLWRNDAGAVAIWNMNGGTVLSGNSLGAVPASWKIAGTGDFNGDGNSDILWRSDDGTVAIWDMKDGAILHGQFTGRGAGQLEDRRHRRLQRRPHERHPVAQ